MENVQISYTHDITVADYLMLRKVSDFKEVSMRQAEIAIENHAYLIVAKDGDRTVGMTRLISDGAFFAVITEVIVLPDYQAAGIGKAMVEHAIAFIKKGMCEGEKVMLLLLSAKGKEGFYTKLGFIQRPDDQYGAGMCQWIECLNESAV